MPQWLFCIIYNIILLIFYFYCDLLSKSQCVTHTIAWTTRKIKLSLHNVFICVSISRPDLAWYLVVNPYMLEGWSNKCLGWWNFKHIPCIFKAYLKFISDIFLATLTLIFFIHMNLGKIIPPSFQHCQVERSYITSSTFDQFWTPPLRHQDYHGSGPPTPPKMMM